MLEEWGDVIVSHSHPNRLCDPEENATIAAPCSHGGRHLKTRLGFLSGIGQLNAAHADTSPERKGKLYSYPVAYNRTSTSPRTLPATRNPAGRSAAQRAAVSSENL